MNLPSELSKTQENHISICICTFKRPAMLAEALDSILLLNQDQLCTQEIVVIDNDKDRSAEKTVRQYQDKSKWRILYACEPEKNIAKARNKAIEMATGDLIAFLDDDEFPTEDWLVLLHRALVFNEADGVLGPVLPHYPSEAPGWLKKADVFERKRFKTGTRVSESDSRTGNVLLRRSSLPEEGPSFDPRFGLTGGEDVDFFARQIQDNKIFVWCDEAAVYETVPPERWSAGFHFRKYFRIGTINGRKNRTKGLQGITGFVKCIVSTFIWGLATLILLPFRKHIWIKPALKTTYSIGCFLAYSGFSESRNKD